MSFPLQTAGATTQRHGRCRMPTVREGSVGDQLYLPAGWARHLESRIDPSERLAELEKDRAHAKAEIRALLGRLAKKHGATERDVTIAMRSIDGTLGDLLYDQQRVLQHEMEDLTPA
jgi:hypothetical protein